MPEGTHTEQLNIPIQTIWDFIKDIDQWAPLVPGYIDHSIRNEHESTWKFHGDLGVVRKKIHMQVNILEWEEPSKVTFRLKGLNEKFNGSGYFLAQESTGEATEMTGHLNLVAKGLKAPLINGVLTSFVPKMTRELTENIVRELR